MSGQLDVLVALSSFTPWKEAEWNPEPVRALRDRQKISCRCREPGHDSLIFGFFVSQPHRIRSRDSPLSSTEEKMLHTQQTEGELHHFWSKCLPYHSRTSVEVWVFWVLRMVRQMVAIWTEDAISYPFLFLGEPALSLLGAWYCVVAPVGS